MLAVLDWELSTLGHPLADFGYHCMAGTSRRGTFRGIGGLDLAALGIPSEARIRAPLLRAHRPRRPRRADGRLGLLPGLQPVPHRRDPAGHRQARRSTAPRRARRRATAGAGARAAGRAGLALRAAEPENRSHISPRRDDMDFEYSPRTKELQAAAACAFMDEHIYPTENALRRRARGQHAGRQALDAAARSIEELKPKARAAGLWNLFLPPTRRSARHEGAGLRTSSTRRCARSWAACPGRREVFNCSAPDTGNMETIERYGSRGAEEAVARAAAATARSARPSR